MNSIFYIVPFLAFFNSMVTSKPLPDERLTAFQFFMGPGPESVVQSISFRPEDGLRFREKFEQKYGPRGRDLIERFGQGLGPGGPSVLDPDNFIPKPQPKKKKHNLPKNSSTKKPTTITKKG